MKMDFQSINHNYIVRLVIFSVFLYKNYINQPKVYEESIRVFVKNRIKYDLDISIECGPYLNKSEKRDLVIDQILDNRDSDKLVSARFRTAFHDVNIQIDLNQEEKYESYLYL